MRRDFYTSFLRTSCILAIIMAGILFPARSSAQSFVSPDQAIEILKFQIESIQVEGQLLYQSGETDGIDELGYRSRYAQQMVEHIRAGVPVLVAVNSSLPDHQFVFGNIETGEVIEGESDINKVRDQLKDWALTVLTN
jgi:hypothetical protein